MRLSTEDADHFIRLHQSLLFYVNRRLGLTDEPADTVEAYKVLPARDRLKVHQAMVDHPELIDAFADGEPIPV